MPRLRYTFELCMFLVQLCFKYKSAGKCHGIFLSSGDKCFENICMKGHKTVTTVTMSGSGSSYLEEHDPIARLHFCNLFLQSVQDGEVEPHLVIFSYEPWFLLSGEVNSQNIQEWSAENPGLIHEFPLLDEKIGVWCVMSACCEISTTSREELLSVNNVLCRDTDCIWSGGQRYLASV